MHQATTSRQVQPFDLHRLLRWKVVLVHHHPKIAHSHLPIGMKFQRGMPLMVVQQHHKNRAPNKRQPVFSFLK